MVGNISEGEILFLVSNDNFLDFEIVEKVCKFLPHAVGHDTSPVIAFIPMLNHDDGWRLEDVLANDDRVQHIVRTLWQFIGYCSRFCP